MNDIRTAILQAADYIQTNPKEFAFHAINVPDCGIPGCALGWIGHFLAMPRTECSYTVAKRVMGRNDYGTERDFYTRMNDLGIAHWTCNAGLCAWALRLYADKYHPAPPNWEALSADTSAIREELAMAGRREPSA